MRLAKWKFDLSRMRYRALVYLLVSVAFLSFLMLSVDVLPSWLGYYLLQIFDLIGVLLIFLFFGRPHMYSGSARPYTIPNVILAYTFLVFGCFLQILLICKLFIAAFGRNRGRQTDSS